jgi:hypothetical protein
MGTSTRKRETCSTCAGMRRFVVCHPEDYARIRAHVPQPRVVVASSMVPDSGLAYDVACWDCGAAQALAAEHRLDV